MSMIRFVLGMVMKMGFEDSGILLPCEHGVLRRMVHGI